MTSWLAERLGRHLQVPLRLLAAGLTHVLSSFWWQLGALLLLALLNN